MSRRRDRLQAEWEGCIAELPCVLCARLGTMQESRTSVHHTREGQGMAQRASPYLGIALCQFGCHQGDHGVHGDKERLRQAKCDELDLLADTIEGVFRRMLTGGAFE